jgi:hypothetical protein
MSLLCLSQVVTPFYERSFDTVILFRFSLKQRLEDCADALKNMVISISVLVEFIRLFCI